MSRKNRLPAGQALPSPGGRVALSLSDDGHNEVDRGCHFAAWQEPALFSAELRTAFRSLR